MLPWNTCIHTYTHTSIHPYIHTYIHTDIYVGSITQLRSNHHFFSCQSENPTNLINPGPTVFCQPPLTLILEFGSIYPNFLMDSFIQNLSENLWNLPFNSRSNPIIQKSMITSFHPSSFSELKYGDLVIISTHCQLILSGLPRSWYI